MIASPFIQKKLAPNLLLFVPILQTDSIIYASIKGWKLSASVRFENEIPFNKFRTIFQVLIEQRGTAIDRSISIAIFPLKSHNVMMRRKRAWNLFTAVQMCFSRWFRTIRRIWRILEIDLSVLYVFNSTMKRHGQNSAKLCNHTENFLQNCYFKSSLVPKLIAILILQARRIDYDDVID